MPAFDASSLRILRRAATLLAVVMPPAAGGRTIRRVLATCLVLVAPGCTDPIATEPAPPDRPFVITTASQTLLVPLGIQVSIQGGNGGDTWASSDDQVASVSQAGFVRARFPGSVTITARRGGQSAELTLSVIASWIEIAPGTVGLAPDSARLLTATARGVNGVEIAGVPITWSTTDPNIASVDSLSGLLTGIAVGHTAVTAVGGGARGEALAFVNTTFGGSLAFSVLGGLYNHLCGLEAVTGLAYCWGDGHAGALGIGNRTGGDDPVAVSGVRSYTALSVGQYATCGLEKQTGFAWCWGHNQYGDLGTGNTVTQWEPARVAGGIRFSTISASGTVTCGVEAHSSVGYCWGRGGLVGDGTLAQRATPTPIGSLLLSSISTAHAHACGVETPSGQVFCWGDNPLGTLGDGTATSRLLPTPVAGSRRFSSISAGEVSCGIEAQSGYAYCWGPNQHGQVGDGTTTARLTPTPVRDGLRFSSLAAGYTATCGIEAESGFAYCWGRNESWSLQGSTLAERLVPTLVKGGRRFDSIGALYYGACGVETGTGLGYCWSNIDLEPHPVSAPVFLAPAASPILSTPP